MNARDKEIREKAWALVSDEERERNELYETRERWERCDQRFADLIRADEREKVLAGERIRTAPPKRPWVGLIDRRILS